MGPNYRERAVAVGAVAHAPYYGNARFDPPAAPRRPAPVILFLLRRFPPGRFTGKAVILEVKWVEDIYDMRALDTWLEYIYRSVIAQFKWNKFSVTAFFRIKINQNTVVLKIFIPFICLLQHQLHTKPHALAIQRRKRVELQCKKTSYVNRPAADAGNTLTHYRQY